MRPRSVISVLRARARNRTASPRSHPRGSRAPALDYGYSRAVRRTRPSPKPGPRDGAKNRYDAYAGPKRAARGLKVDRRLRPRSELGASSSRTFCRAVDDRRGVGSEIASCADYSPPEARRHCPQVLQEASLKSGFAARCIELLQWVGRCCCNHPTCRHRALLAPRRCLAAPPAGGAAKPQRVRHYSDPNRIQGSKRPRSGTLRMRWR